MKSDFVYCPLLNNEIAEPLCLSITYAAEGRLGHSAVPEITDWEMAKDVCADCVNAYWNRNNLEHPAL